MCLTQATESIAMTTPYFLPDDDIVMALKAAVARGVQVRIIVPNRIDHKIVALASRTYLGELLEAGVEIYKYDKGFLHPKILVIDGTISDVGAANIDRRSFRLNYEVNSVFFSEEVAGRLMAQFEQDVLDAIPLQMSELLQRSLPQRLMEQTARILAPLL